MSVLAHERGSSNSKRNLAYRSLIPILEAITPESTVQACGAWGDIANELSPVSGARHGFPYRNQGATTTVAIFQDLKSSLHTRREC